MLFSPILFGKKKSKWHIKSAFSTKEKRTLIHNREKDFFREEQKKTNIKHFLSPQKKTNIFSFLPKTKKIWGYYYIERIFMLRVFFVGFFSLLLFSFFPFLTLSEAKFPFFPTFQESSLDYNSLTLHPGVFSEENIQKSRYGILEYKTKSGETVSEVAYRFGVSKDEIFRFNFIGDANRLPKNVILKIPVVGGLQYEVQSGENLEKIAQRFFIEEKQIRIANNIPEDKKVYVGQDLFIPGKPVLSLEKEKEDVVLVFPTKGKYTQKYHYGHYAVDIAYPGGASIYAADRGKVIRSRGGWNGGYGNVVIIDHENGMKTLYAHLRDIDVRVGDHVERGEQIGFMGNTGRSIGITGIHLHFEVIVNGIKRNPINFFEE